MTTGYSGRACGRPKREAPRFGVAVFVWPDHEAGMNGALEVLLRYGYWLLLVVVLAEQSGGEVFPRVAGMLMSGLGLSIFGMIRARSYEQYPATLFMRVYFIVCFVVFYVTTRDPLFLILIGIVGFGLVLTLAAYVRDRTAVVADSRSTRSAT